MDVSISHYLLRLLRSEVLLIQRLIFGLGNRALLP